MKEIEHIFTSVDDRNILIEKLYREGVKYTYTDIKKDGTYVVKEYREE